MGLIPSSVTALQVSVVFIVEMLMTVSLPILVRMVKPARMVTTHSVVCVLKAGMVQPAKMLMTVTLPIHVRMVEPVQMGMAHTPVTVLLDSLDITVKKWMTVLMPRARMVELVLMVTTVTLVTVQETLVEIIAKQVSTKNRCISTIERNLSW